MSKKCESIVPPYSLVNNVLTNNSTLQVSKGQTDVGTVVKLRCLYNYTLQAESETVVCQENQQWNFTTKPKCVPPVKPAVFSTLTEEQKIILGVGGGVGGLVLIILIVMTILICLKKRSQDRKTRQGEISSDGTLDPRVLGEITDYPQRYPYIYAEDFRNGDYGRGIGNPNYRQDLDIADPRMEYVREIPVDRNGLDVRPSMGYDTLYTGGPVDDLRGDTRDYVNRSDHPQRDLDDRRLPVTNAVRMFEEYGRPSRVRMLEEAYELQRPYRLRPERLNHGLRAFTSRSAETYGLRGEDPTRYYGGFYN
ncbi:uncharacterized protein LOC135462979 isoform X2 [Liolophura sinensis]|uniref:uncharacterized protein LOC135462979 isoform X1 n=1 Tax=Liolophura sinensis TaxID=3198878 RepID=UPI0031594139